MDIQLTLIIHDEVHMYDNCPTGEMYQIFNIEIEG